MVCQDCKQKPATVHLTKIIQGIKNETHLCEECARNRQSKSFEDSFPIHNFLAGLLDVNADSMFKEESIIRIACSNCGMTFENFKKTGRLGCSNCYKEFNNKLNSLIRKIHGNINHTGKVPIRTGGIIRKRREIQQLRVQLDNAISMQEFERAAEIRDKIKEIDRQILDM